MNIVDVSLLTCSTYYVLWIALASCVVIPLWCITLCFHFGMLCSVRVCNTRWTSTVMLQYYPVIALCLDNHLVTVLFMNSVAHKTLIKEEEKGGVRHSQSRDWGRAWERERSWEGERGWVVAMVAWVVDHCEPYVAADIVVELLPLLGATIVDCRRREWSLLEVELLCYADEWIELWWKVHALSRDPWIYLILCMVVIVMPWDFMWESDVFGIPCWESSLWQPRTVYGGFF